MRYASLANSLFQAFREWRAVWSKKEREKIKAREGERWEREPQCPSTFHRFYLLRTAIHYLNAWNRLEVKKLRTAPHYLNAWNRLLFQQPILQSTERLSDVCLEIRQEEPVSYTCCVDLCIQTVFPTLTLSFSPGRGGGMSMAFTEMCCWTGYGFRPLCLKQSIQFRTSLS